MDPVDRPSESSKLGANGHINRLMKDNMKENTTNNVHKGEETRKNYKRDVEKDTQQTTGIATNILDEDLGGNINGFSAEFDGDVSQEFEPEGEFATRPHFPNHIPNYNPQHAFPPGGHMMSRPPFVHRNSSSSSIARNNDQMNLSRTVILKNIVQDISLSEVLDEIEFGPLESCRMTSRPTPKHIVDADSNAPKILNTCSISFTNARSSILFHLKYFRQRQNLETLRARLRSPHLKVQLSEFAQLPPGSSSSPHHDFIKLKTINYIVDFGATRCVILLFSVPKGTREAERAKVHDEIRHQCDGIGDVEDFRVVLYETVDEFLEGKILVHFTSIDAAIRAYESYLKVIRGKENKESNENEEKDNKESKEKEEDKKENQDEEKSHNGNEYSDFEDLDNSRLIDEPFLSSSFLQTDVSILAVGFHKDRCDRISKKDILDVNVMNPLVDDFEGVSVSDLLDSSEDYYDDSYRSTSTPGFVPYDGYPENNMMPGMAPGVPNMNGACPPNPNGNWYSGYPPFPPSTPGYAPMMSPGLPLPYQGLGLPAPGPIYDFASHNAAVQAAHAHAHAAHVAAMAAAQGAHVPVPDVHNIGNRTVFLGKLHANTTVEEIANNVRVGGLVESINHHPDKKVCFITFVDAQIALKFYMNHQVLHQLIIHGNDVDVGWAKKKLGPLSREIALAVTAGASRNMYIGVISNGDKTHALPDEPTLRRDFLPFGGLEQINFYHNGGCGFVNFLNIADAIRAVEAFEIQDPEQAIERITEIFKSHGTEDAQLLASKCYHKYKHFKIKFAKDRCGNQPKFSFRKKPPNSTMSTYQQYQHLLNNNVRSRNKQKEKAKREQEKHELNSFMQDTINQEAAMVFGIISKESTNLEDDDQTDREDPAPQDTPSPFASGEIMAANGSSLPEKPSQQKENEVSEDESDDEVSIITNSDDAASFTAQNGVEASHVLQAQNTKRFNNRFSRNSSSVSLGRHGRPKNISSALIPSSVNTSPFITNLSLHMQTPQHGRSRYHHPSTYAYSPATQGYFLPQPPQHPHYYEHGYREKKHYPGSSLAYSTSGSQIMAQYLAKSQQDNLMYAASVLSAEDNADDYHGDVPYGYYPPPPLSFHSNGLYRRVRLRK